MGVAVVATVVVGMSCNSTPELPVPPGPPLKYSTTRITIRDCSVEIPPVRDDLAGCPAEAIGQSIPPEAVCESLVALKGWMANNPLSSPNMEPGDWSRIRAITVCHSGEPYGQEPSTSKTFELEVDADVPQRPYGAGDSALAIHRANRLKNGISHYDRRVVASDGGHTVVFRDAVRQDEVVQVWRNTSRGVLTRC